MPDESIPFGISVAREYLKICREKLISRVPDPTEHQLIRTDYEYSMTELKDLLQILGAHLSTLTALVGEIEADLHIMAEGFKLGMQTGLADYKGDATQVSVKQSEVMVGDSQLSRIKEYEIEIEACFILAKSWRKSYEDAYTTVSRIGSFDMSEAALQGRHL
jgi:hypothetical protein